MISELRIKNLALIESLHLEFSKGLTVFTGETGAGKSILIGAIGLLLGDRASSESIRNGCNDAEVSGVFEFSSLPDELVALLDELSIVPEENALIIRRRISRTDRSKIHVNDTALSLSALRRLGSLLVDMHGQHEHQSLLNEETHRTFIDRLDAVKSVLATYHTHYTSLASANSALSAFLNATKLIAEKRDILEFQLNELDQADLASGEENKLESELTLLTSSAQRIASVSAVLDTLSSDNDFSLEKQISTIRKNLDNLMKFDSSAGPWLDDLENATRVFTELESFCSTYLSSIGEESAPERIETINARLAKLQRLKKKYHSSVDELIEKLGNVRNELASLENSDSERRELETKVRQEKDTCIAAAQRLTTARKKAAKKFDASVTKLMMQLGFKEGIWRTVFEPLPDPTEYGMEQVRFFVRTNPGEPELPLAATASGGEISRLMLAIKSILSKDDFVPVLIFDEIDTGIGGTIAGHVGMALQKLSTTHQVLCISHLHQIASLADYHLKVFKETNDNRTVTRVVTLTDSERIYEIARMLGGDSSIALQHATELLQKRHATV